MAVNNVVKTSNSAARGGRKPIYIYKILNQVHPDSSGISRIAMNSFVNDISERIANESAKLSNHNGLSTISSRKIQTS